METTATRMVRGQDPIRRRLRRKVLLPMTKNGFAHEIPDSPHAGAPSNLAQKVLCTCCRHYSGAASGRITSLISSRRSSLPRKGCRVGLRIVLFEACSASACTLALPPIRDTLIEGFSHFVASMTTPIASGWSGCRVGLAPTGKRRLVTAHTLMRHLAWSRPCGQLSAAMSRPANARALKIRSFSCVRVPACWVCGCITP